MRAELVYNQGMENIDMNIKSIRKELRALADPAQAANLRRFFKTGAGEYGEGDEFLGLKVPQTRAIARKYIALAFGALEELLGSRIHEERLAALIILRMRYEKAPEGERRQIFDFYLKHTAGINNWDLVDLSAPYITGEFLRENPREVLYSLIKSDDLWERRIALLSTFAFIRRGDFDDALRLAELSLGDKHDLMHKAAGWMLREIGKRDMAREKEFLEKHCRKMPRTMLRYAIEKLPEGERKRYMRK